MRCAGKSKTVWDVGAMKSVYVRFDVEAETYEEAGKEVEEALDIAIGNCVSEFGKLPAVEKRRVVRSVKM